MGTITRPTRKKWPVRNVAYRVRLTPHSQSIYVRANPSFANASYASSLGNSCNAWQMVCGVWSGNHKRRICFCRRSSGVSACVMQSRTIISPSRSASPALMIVSTSVRRQSVWMMSNCFCTPGSAFVLCGACRNSKRNCLGKQGRLSMHQRPSLRGLGLYASISHRENRCPNAQVTRYFSPA